MIKTSMQGRRPLTITPLTTMGTRLVLTRREKDPSSERAVTISRTDYIVSGMLTKTGRTLLNESRRRSRLCKVNLHTPPWRQQTTCQSHCQMAPWVIRRSVSLPHLSRQRHNRRQLRRKLFMKVRRVNQRRKIHEIGMAYMEETKAHHHQCPQRLPSSTTGFQIERALSWTYPMTLICSSEKAKTREAMMSSTSG